MLFVRPRLRVEFKPADVWVGAYFRREDVASGGGIFGYDYDVWVCVIPMLPIHLSWTTTPWEDQTK